MIKKIIKKLMNAIGWCDYCNKIHPFRIGIKKRKLNTAYVDDEQNWMISCLPAFLETVGYYKEKWEEYYASRF